MVLIINNVILYLRTKKASGAHSTNPQLEQNESDADRQMPPESDSCHAGEEEQATISEISTLLVPSPESTSSIPQDSDAPHPLSSASSSVPPSDPTVSASYQEIISSVTRYAYIEIFI